MKKKVALFVLLVTVLAIGMVFAQGTGGQGVSISIITGTGGQKALKITNNNNYRVDVDFKCTVTYKGVSETYTGQQVIGAKKTETYQGGRGTRTTSYGWPSGTTISNIVITGVHSY